MEFQKISSPSLRELFVEQVQHMILSGKLKIGEKLPPERQLAEEMQVSRAVVNGGIADLQRMGFLIVKPRSGTYVADYRRTGTIETLLSIMKYNGGSLRNEEIRSICEVRIALDTLVVRLCLPTIREEETELLYQKVCEIKEAAKTSEAIQAAFEFQHEFALMSGNALVPLIVQSFKTPIFAMWERYCTLYGVEALYKSNYKMWTYVRDKDVEGAVAWIEDSMKNCIEGDQQIYYE